MDYPQLFLNVENPISWEDWEEKTTKKLEELGYRKYNQQIKKEDYAYWKTFEINDKKRYQVGIFFYDFRKYYLSNIPERIGIGFECMLIDINGRIDLSITKDITLQEVEEMSLTFYNSMSKYCY